MLVVLVITVILLGFYAVGVNIRLNEILKGTNVAIDNHAKILDSLRDRINDIEKDLEK